MSEKKYMNLHCWQNFYTTAHRIGCNEFHLWEECQPSSDVIIVVKLLRILILLETKNVWTDISIVESKCQESWIYWKYVGTDSLTCTQDK